MNSLMITQSCHEECAIKRDYCYNVIADYALKNPDIEKQIEQQILSDKTWRGYKEVLFGVLKTIAEKKAQKNHQKEIAISPFILECLKHPKYDYLREDLIDAFGNVDNKEFLDILYQIVSNRKLNQHERAEAMNTLGNRGNAKTAEFFINLITDETENMPLRYTTAWKMPTLLQDRNIKMKKEWVDRLSPLLFAQDTDPYFKTRIMEINCFYDNTDKNYVIEMLKKVYTTSKDKFLKDRAVDILHGYGLKNYQNPVISDQEWEKHSDDKLNLF